MLTKTIDFKLSPEGNSVFVNVALDFSLEPRVIVVASVSLVAGIIEFEGLIVNCD